MKNILIISKRETSRLRSRFRGRARIFVLMAIVLSIAISYIISQQGFLLNKDFYVIGVPPNSPVPVDERFNVVVLDRAVAQRMLYERNIDIYLDRNVAMYRDDQRSQYAIGALKQFLEKQELIRISNEYGLDEAFPLRIEVNYLKAPEGNVSAGSTERGAIDFIENDEQFLVVIPLTGVNCTAYDVFTVQIIPPTGASLTVRRIVPGNVLAVNNLH